MPTTDGKKRVSRIIHSYENVAWKRKGRSSRWSEDKVRLVDDTGCRRLNISWYKNINPLASSGPLDVDTMMTMMWNVSM